MIENSYLWLKIGHIVSIVTWMAGMFYLPRLYVYHAQLNYNDQAYEIFKTMERKLLRIIINPSMVMAWGFGLLLAWQANYWMQGWFHAKLTLVIILQILHICLAKWRRDFEKGKNRHSPRFYKWINEIPTLVLIFIVILVILKPF
ncbi:MAG: protoporphyrinogen oxidase HemJ [Alphaproteobacteria bacterium]|nr:protoporphyrinogen oxidase HemJ [Alphaproteobacteria bacterium]